MANAYTIRGTKTPLSFGTTTIEGYIVDEQGIDKESEFIEIDDEEGRFVIDISGWGEKHRRRLKVIPLDNSTEPVAGDVLAYGVAGAEKMIVDTIRKVKVKKDVERWDIEGHSHPGIELIVPAP